MTREREFLYWLRGYIDASAVDGMPAVGDLSQRHFTRIRKEMDKVLGEGGAGWMSTPAPPTLQELNANYKVYPCPCGQARTLGHPPLPMWCDAGRHLAGIQRVQQSQTARALSKADK